MPARVLPFHHVATPDLSWRSHVGRRVRAWRAARVLLLLGDRWPAFRAPLRLLAGAVAIVAGLLP